MQRSLDHGSTHVNQYINTSPIPINVHFRISGASKSPRYAFPFHKLFPVLAVVHVNYWTQQPTDKTINDSIEEEYQEGADVTSTEKGMGEKMFEAIKQRVAGNMENHERHP
jgi:hypothetical protein